LGEKPVLSDEGIEVSPRGGASNKNSHANAWLFLFEPFLGEKFILSEARVEVSPTLSANRQGGGAKAERCN